MSMFIGEFFMQCTLCNSSFKNEKLYDIHSCVNADIKVPVKTEAALDEEEAELEMEVNNVIRQASKTIKEESVFYVKAEKKDAESQSEDPLGLDIDNPEPEEISNGSSKGFKVIGCDFECSICKKNFLREEDFINHKKNVHKDSKPFQCRDCNKKFSRQQYLKLHMLIHSGKRPYKCNLCLNTFTYKSSYDIHLRTHKFEPTFRCVICRQICQNKSEFDKHMKSHMKEMGYACDVCGDEFSSARSLTAHRMKTHMGNKTYECQYCGRSFRNWHKHKIHERLHTGERPYKCKICGKGFPRNDEVKRHMQSHQGIKAFQCSICSVYCATQASITGHVDLHHAELKPDHSMAPEKPLVFDSLSGILGTKLYPRRTLFEPVISAASRKPCLTSHQKIDPPTPISGNNKRSSNESSKCLSYKEYLEQQEKMLARRGLIVRDPKCSYVNKASLILSPKKDAVKINEKQIVEANVERKVINILSQTPKSGGMIKEGLSESLPPQVHSNVSTSTAFGAKLKLSQPTSFWPQTAAGRCPQIVLMKSVGNQQTKKNASQPVVLLCGYDADNGEQVMLTQSSNVGSGELQKILLPSSTISLHQEPSLTPTNETVEIKEELTETVYIKEEHKLQITIKKEPGVEQSREVVIKQEPEYANVVYTSTFGKIEIKQEPVDDS